MQLNHSTENKTCAGWAMLHKKTNVHFSSFTAHKILQITDIHQMLQILNLQSQMTVMKQKNTTPIKPTPGPVSPKILELLVVQTAFQSSVCGLQQCSSRGRAYASWRREREMQPPRTT